jgi:hypothetical protein
MTRNSGFLKVFQDNLNHGSHRKTDDKAIQTFATFSFSDKTIRKQYIWDAISCCGEGTTSDISQDQSQQGLHSISYSNTPSIPELKTMRDMKCNVCMRWINPGFDDPVVGRLMMTMQSE